MPGAKAIPATHCGVTDAAFFTKVVYVIFYYNLKDHVRFLNAL